MAEAAAPSAHRNTGRPPADVDPVPPEVMRFLQDINKAMVEHDADIANYLYEKKINDLTQLYYSQKPTPKGQQPERKLHWPKLSQVKHCFSSPFVEHFYNAYHLRSIYNTNLPNGLRTQAWDAFGTAAGSVMSSHFNITVPGGWLWDLVDEYLYQLQMFGNRRLKGANKDKEDAPSPAHVGSASEAQTQLEGLVAKSNIRATLDAVRAGTVPASSVIDATQPQRNLGLFALIGLIRLRVQLADYHGALKLAEALDPHGFGAQLTTRVPAAHSSLFYHIGFAHLMLRRYEDASSLLVQALGVKAGGRKYLDSQQFNVVCLLLVVETLGGLPKQADFTSFVNDRNRATLEEDSALLPQGDLDRFREVFSRSAPKFIAPVTASAGIRIQTSQNGTVYETSAQEAKEVQLTVFMREVNHQLEPLRLRSLLQVYSTVSISKLASLLSKSEDDAVAMLISAKRKNLLLTQRTGEKKAELRTVGEVDFTSASGSVSVQRRTVVTPSIVKFYDRVVAIGSAK